MDDRIAAPRDEPSFINPDTFLPSFESISNNLEALVLAWENDGVHMTASSPYPTIVIYRMCAGTHPLRLPTSILPLFLLDLLA